MSNQNNLRAFLEVTALAVMLFAVPIAYYHGRDGVLQWQNKLYYKVFGIREEHLQKIKERLAKEEAEDIAESEKVTQL
jgi:hypothetical protein